MLDLLHNILPSLDISITNLITHTHTHIYSSTFQHIHPQLNLFWVGLKSLWNPTMGGFVYHICHSNSIKWAALSAPPARSLKPVHLGPVAFIYGPGALHCEPLKSSKISPFSEKDKGSGKRTHQSTNKQMLV